MQQRYCIEPLELDALALKADSKTALPGKPMIQAIGDGQRIVSKIGKGA